MALEVGYRAIGVPEIVFIDPRKHEVRFLRRWQPEYVEEVVTAGTFVRESLGGLRLESDWLFPKLRSGMRATVNSLLALTAASNAGP